MDPKISVDISTGQVISTYFVHKCFARMDPHVTQFISVTKFLFLGAFKLLELLLTFVVLLFLIIMVYNIPLQNVSSSGTSAINPGNSLSFVEY